MAIKKSQIEKWIVAQKKHRLLDTHVQMARELGLNPDKLGKIDNHRQEPWKAPLPEFIEEIFYKRFKKERPDIVKPLKQILKEQEINDDEKMRELERVIMLKVIDSRWMDHIDDMDQMRQGISLQSYAQKDPLIEYKYASYDMFEEMSNSIQADTVKTLYRVRVVTEAKREEVAKPMFTNKDDSVAAKPVQRKTAKVGRNDPCPCGSGKKYKNCCGRNA